MNLLNPKKLKAFTLLELSVVMVIAGIVFAICYSAYNIVLRQYEEYKNANETVIGISALKAVLTKDFCEAKEIRKSGDDIQLTKTDGSKITYSFESSGLLRKVNDTKEKFFPAINIKASLLGAEQTESNGLVDELYFEIEKENLPLHIKKYYAADVLMELKNGNQ